MSTPRIVLFDFDGTLTDSAPDLCAAANERRLARGLAPLPFAALREWCGHGVRGLLWAALRLTPDALCFADEQKSFLSWYARHLLDHCALFPEVTELLAGLSARGIRYGIVTNKASTLAAPIADHLGLSSRACLVGGDMVERGKPAPFSIEMALQRTGFSAQEAVYVGDDARDIAAGHNAGMRAIAAAWGYTEGKENAWGADFVAATPLRILDFISAA